MDRFVCVRIVQANGMDLSLFQFDFDLTFAAFFMNADKTIYGRFGSRSDREDAMKNVSVEGFRQALAAALEVHRRYPANKASLAGKRGPAPRYRVPEEYPSLSPRSTSRARWREAACTVTRWARPKGRCSAPPGSRSRMRRCIPGRYRTWWA
jgi:hypothetical protein